MTYFLELSLIGLTPICLSHFYLHPILFIKRVFTKEKKEKKKSNLKEEKKITAKCGFKAEET